MTTHPAPGQAPPGLGTLPEVRSGLTAAVLFGLTPLAQSTHLGVDRAMLVAAVLTTGMAASLPRWHALLLAVTGWALLTGFVVNDAAQLTFSTSDLERLALLAGLALAAAAVRSTVAHAPTPIRRAPVRERVRAPAGRLRSPGRS